LIDGLSSHSFRASYFRSAFTFFLNQQFSRQTNSFVWFSSFYIPQHSISFLIINTWVQWSTRSSACMLFWNVMFNFIMFY
jgi:hypothetical protein